MTRIDYGSDLHLAFGGFNILNLPENPGEILILAGDIFEAVAYKDKGKTLDGVLDFYAKLEKTYEKIFMVLGNHEHYDNHFSFTARNIRHRLQEFGFTKFEVLDNDTVDYKDLIIFGATMWTSYRNRNPFVMADAKQFMNDYKSIFLSKYHNEYSQIDPEFIYKQHMKTRQELEFFAKLETSKKKVVITHHAPSQVSVPEYFKTNALNDCYYEDLGNLIYGSNIQLWVHGHIHDKCEYMIGETKIVCNPRGYHSYEVRAHNFDFEQVEV